MEKETEQQNEGHRSFSKLIAELGDGEAHVELSRALNHLCSKLRREAQQQCKDQRGELSLKLTLVTSPDTMTFAIGYEVKVKEPSPRRPGSVYWLTKGGNLTVENPRQQALPLREVNMGGIELKDIGAAEEAKEA